MKKEYQSRSMCLCLHVRVWAFCMDGHFQPEQNSAMNEKIKQMFYGSSLLALTHYLFFPIQYCHYHVSFASPLVSKSWVIFLSSRVVIFRCNMHVFCLIPHWNLFQKEQNQRIFNNGKDWSMCGKKGSGRNKEELEKNNRNILERFCMRKETAG